MKFLNKVYNFFEGFNASINGYNFCPEKKKQKLQDSLRLFLKTERESYSVQSSAFLEYFHYLRGSNVLFTLA